VRNRLAERILSEADLHRILSLEPNPRNRAMVTFLKPDGCRSITRKRQQNYRASELRAPSPAARTAPR
jgi:hypothetical protein